MATTKAPAATAATPNTAAIPSTPVAAFVGVLVAEELAEVPDVELVVVLVWEDVPEEVASLDVPDVEAGASAKAITPSADTAKAVADTVVKIFLSFIVRFPPKNFFKPRTTRRFST